MLLVFNDSAVKKVIYSAISRDSNKLNKLIKTPGSVLGTALKPLEIKEKEILSSVRTRKLLRYDPRKEEAKLDSQLGKKNA